MKLTSHNLVDGNTKLRFVQWSTQGTGMVNVFVEGSGGGDIMSLQGAREYWTKCVREFGYKKAESDTFSC